MTRPIITPQKKRIIVDVDTQRHFFRDNSPVRVLEHGCVLNNIRRVIAWTRLRRVQMVSTVQVCTHNTCHCCFCLTDITSLRKVDFTLRNKRICYDATDSTDFATKIFEQYDQLILHKRCFDPFEEPRADRILTELDADEFIVIGTLAEGAVKATALGLLVRRKNVTVLVDAIGSLDKAATKITLRNMWAKGAKLTDTEKLLGGFLPATCGSVRLRLSIRPNYRWAGFSGISLG